MTIKPPEGPKDWEARLNKITEDIGHYILVGRDIKKVSFMEWALWFEHARTERILRQEFVGKVKVSTVFLGLDHGWGRGRPPILFETMIFGGPHDDYQTRCATYADALEMHRAALRLVRGIKLVKHAKK